jgi:hypothetical protein
LVPDALAKTSRKVLASKFFAHTRRTYRFGHMLAAEKEQQNSTLLIEH